MKKTIILLVGWMICSMFTFFLFAFYSYKNLHTPGSFLRTYSKSAVKKSSEKNIGYNSWYIAGVDDHAIYLGNFTNPTVILKLDNNLSRQTTFNIDFSHIKEVPVFSSSKVQVSVPYFYFFDGYSGNVMRGLISDWAITDLVCYSIYFRDHTVTDRSTTFIKSSTVSGEMVLGKIDHKTSQYFSNPLLLRKQIDGVFCTDGTMTYKKELGYMIYTYFYRNEYLVIDTSLTLVKRRNTIDTITRANIKSVFVPSRNSYKLLSKKMLNWKTSTNGKYFYVLSTSMAKNDIPEAFKRKSTVDVYNLINGKYVASFDLFTKNTKTKIKDFMVYKNKYVFAIYDDYVGRYNIDPKFFR